MTDKTENHHSDNKERRLHNVTWPWFILNIIVFPGPAHLYLLRARDFSSGKNLRHIGMTFLLFFILFTAAALQLAVPSVGRLWMLFPLLSGFVVLYFSLSIKTDFRSFDFSMVKREQKILLISAIFLFIIISLLPSLNLIELNQKSGDGGQHWLGILPFWQDMLILLVSLLFLFGGYIVNAGSRSTINRLFILYACYILIDIQMMLPFYFSVSWLKIQGGFWLQLIVTLLAASLALDYWDAKGVGQFVRRYFFLTCTKGVSVIFLILCFYGLPQKTASVFSTYYFNKVRPAPIEISPRYLILSKGDRIGNAHTATRQIRALYARSVLNQTPEALETLTAFVTEHKGSILPADSDVCQIGDLLSQSFKTGSVVDFEKIPFFRPIHPDWDVMLTALLGQGLILENDVDRYIAGFKKILPKTSTGELPDLERQFYAHYVSQATGLKADFIEPGIDDLELLLEGGLHPVLSLGLSGRRCWATLLSINRKSGIAWFRTGTFSGTHKAIQRLFDSGESVTLKHEILSRMLVPVSIDYLSSTLVNYSAPAVVFSRKGLAETMPERFDSKDLKAINNAISVSTVDDRSFVTDPDFFKSGGVNRYADYLKAVARVKLMLKPEKYGRDLLTETVKPVLSMSGIKRLHEIRAILKNLSPLRENDRMEIAYLLARNNHVSALPALFESLVQVKPLFSDLVDCREAFMIGRELFLLGHHKQAYDYFNLAFLRHPYDVKYELWYNITRAKLKMTPQPFCSPLDLKPGLALYYRTIVDLNNGNEEKCRKRLEKVLKKDSHNSLANHLLSKYFEHPLGDRHFLPAQEGL